CEIFDPRARRWESANPMRYGRTFHAATLLKNGKVLVTGGSAESEIYDPQTNQWSLAAPMQSKRSHHAAVRTGGGRVFAVGGTSRQGEMYDPQTDRWKLISCLNFDRSGNPFKLTPNVAAIVLPKSRFLVVGESSQSEYYEFDEVPPQPPELLTANGRNPSPWNNRSSYTIQWRVSKDPSGTEGAFYSLNGSNAEFVSTVSSFTADFQGLINGDANILNVWLKDGAGNSDPSLFSKVFLRMDTLPPESVASLPKRDISSVPVRVNFKSLDQELLSGVLETRLWYRRDANDDGDFDDPEDHAWTLAASSLAKGTLPLSTGTFLFDPVTLLGPDVDGFYELCTQAVDAAGNVEAAPLIAKSSFLLDRTAPKFLSVSVPLNTPTFAKIAWQTDDRTIGEVIYSTNGSLSHPYPSVYSSSVPSKIQEVYITQLPSPTTVYFQINVTNKALFSTTQKGSLVTKPELVIPIHCYITETDKAIQFKTSNPDISTLTLILNKNTPQEQVIVATGILAGKGYDIYLDTRNLISGTNNTVEILVPGYDPVIQEFLVDTTPRNHRACNYTWGVSGGKIAHSLVDIAGGHVKEPKIMDFTVGQVSDGDFSNLSTGGRSKIFLGYYSGYDTLPPAKIKGLAYVPGPEPGQITLQWTATGDDETVGKAMRYEIRSAPIQFLDEDELELSQASIFVSRSSPTYLPLPSASGSPEKAVLSDLESGRNYYFAVRAEDELGYFSSPAFLGPCKT
ncbi:MAG: hypothetical protein HYY07_01650, partial [Elusimicrobia bacterium]|nr:hypothetical protein [Elusimicrobiota bacterium]